MDNDIKNMLRLLISNENVFHPKQSKEARGKRLDFYHDLTEKKHAHKPYIISNDTKTQEVWKEHYICDECGMPCEYYWFLSFLVFECHTEYCSRCYSKERKYNWNKCMLGSYIIATDIEKLICLDEVYECRWDCCIAQG